MLSRNHLFVVCARNKITAVNIDTDSKFICFEPHNIYNIVHGLHQIELFYKLSKLSSTQLSVVKHIVNDEAQNSRGTTLEICWFYMLRYNFFNSLFALIEVFGVHNSQCFLQLLVKPLLFLCLALNGICWVSHLMWNSCINQWEESFLTQSHFIKYFLWYINKLDYVMFFKESLNCFLAHLNVNKLLLFSYLDWIDHLVYIVFNVSSIHCK